MQNMSLVKTITPPIGAQTNQRQQLCLRKQTDSLANRYNSGPQNVYLHNYQLTFVFKQHLISMKLKYSLEFRKRISNVVHGRLHTNLQRTQMARDRISICF